MKIGKMIKCYVRCGFAAAITAGMLFSSCQREDFNDGPTAPEANVEVSFTSAVLSNQMATRADATIVNWKQTSLPPTEKHTYYRVDESGNVVAEEKTFYAGLFGCYTGPYNWASLMLLHGVMNDKDTPDEITADEFTTIRSLSSYGFHNFDDYATKEDLQAAAPTILNQYYSANQMYNVMANIGTAASGANSLTYSPIHLWPNDGKNMTFFGYYPYNATSAQGDYGIAIVSDKDGVGEGQGMGKVHFTMHPDASLQNDFLISAPVVDCTREQYPLQLNSSGTGYTPKPVRLSLYHMLAQVRIYAYVRGDDKMVYIDANGDGEADVADAAWLTGLSNGTHIIKDEWGAEYQIVKADGPTYTITNLSLQADYPSDPKVTLTQEQFLALGLKIPDESQCIRWARTHIWDVSHSRRRAAIDYSMEFNNIKTSASFYPDYSNPSGATIGCTPATTLGYATINHYIMNPYWFTFKDNQRERLNDNYMFGLYEDTPAYNRLNASTTMVGYDDVDGMDWSTFSASSTDPLNYLAGKDEAHLNLLKGPDGVKHYNYATGNILLVVPQELSDDDVPHIVITAKGRNAANTEDLSAKVTINMLKMGIKWESGFIYCYAFLDDLQPGDDKVRGPESITVVFDTSQYTDQW